MSTVVEDTLQHISRTIQAMPSAVITQYPDLSSGGFADVERMGGARIELGALVGRSRVFEIDLNQQAINPLQIGQGVPSCYDVNAVVRVRYDAQGASVKRSVYAQAIREQTAIIKAIVSSGWHTVSGLVNLVANQGIILEGSAVDDAGTEFNFVLSEISLDFSVDI